MLRPRGSIMTKHDCITSHTCAHVWYGLPWRVISRSIAAHQRPNCGAETSKCAAAPTPLPWSGDESTMIEPPPLALIPSSSIPTCTISIVTRRSSGNSAVELESDQKSNSHAHASRDIARCASGVSGGIDGRAVSVVGAAGSLAIIPIGSPFAPIASGGRPIAAAPAMVESGSPYLYI